MMSINTFYFKIFLKRIFCSLQVLSHSATREETHIQSLLNKKSGPAILLVNQTYTKMLNCFIIFFLQLSEKFYFALYVALFLVKK